MPGREQRVERRHGEFGRSHEGDAHRSALTDACPSLQTPYLGSHGIVRNRGAHPGAGAASGARPALGAPRRAAPDEEARDRAGAAAARAGDGEREAVGLRASAAMSTRSIPAPSAPIRAATRGCSAWSRRCRTCGRSTARGCFPGRFHVLGGRLSALEGVRPEDLAIDAPGLAASPPAASTRWCWR